jgi:hypothetical protein
LVAGLARALDKGRGCLKETVEGVSIQGDEYMRGLGALHLAAGNGNLEMCRYLVEVLRVEVDALDHGGQFLFPSRQNSHSSIPLLELYMILLACELPNMYTT